MRADVSQDSQASDRLYEQAKRILGISDTYQGHSDKTAQSGKAKELQIQQAAGRLDSKRKMKNAAYAEMDRIIFSYYLAYADEVRTSVYKDAHGRLQNAVFNRYDFIEQGEDGEYYYDDGYIFETDSASDIESLRERLWEENRENFKLGAYGDPAKVETQLIFWQNMERAHYPYARDNVERLREGVSS